VARKVVEVMAHKGGWLTIQERWWLMEAQVQVMTGGAGVWVTIRGGWFARWVVGVEGCAGLEVIIGGGVGVVGVR